MRRSAVLIVLTCAALAVPTAARAQPTGAAPGRLVCLDGTRELYLTPEQENIPGTAPVPGPCPSPHPTTTTTAPQIVTLCIQGVTTTGPKGATNPTGIPYREGPCETPAPVKARPKFTG